MALNDPMSASDLADARRIFGVSAALFAKRLGYVGGPRVVYAWERDERAIPITVAILVRLAISSPTVRRRLLGS